MDVPSYHLNDDPDTGTITARDVMVSHFPQYNLFDPMTAFPSGKHIAWGSMFISFLQLFRYCSAEPSVLTS
jgi:hypothetical protein